MGIHDNFFELGGHSLLAVRVLARILERWPYLQLTIASFLQAPTIAEFAAIVRSDQQVPTECVVPFRKSGTRPPFFCLPGGGGNIVSLRRLAAGMSKEQPFYCLQAKGLDGTDPLRTVEEAAGFYIEKIRTIQPHGPYNVGGACFGGLVAFEVACRLREHGEEIGLLTLIDTYNFAYGRSLPKPRLLYENLRFYARRTRYHVRNMRTVAWKNRVGYALARTEAVRLYLKDLLGVTKNSRNQLPILVPPVQVGEEAGVMRETLNRVTKASVEAARTYMPHYYPGEILLFKASERLAEPYEDSALGWTPFASHVKIAEIDANHENILDRIASRIEAAIQQKCPPKPKFEKKSA